MAGRKFYIADWHYGHANAIGFDNRPFKSVEEMNEALVERWNNAVEPGDIVYVLGDMFWRSTGGAEVLGRLNGQKILIKGNHDRCNEREFAKSFEKITDYLEVVDGENHVILCHYPIPCFKNHFYGYIHLYGHVHSSFEWNMMCHQKFLMEELYERQCRMYNVGVMMSYMDYTPRTLEEILAANENEQKDT